MKRPAVWNSKADDIDDYFGILEEMYKEGFRLISTFRWQKRTGWFNREDWVTFVFEK